MRSETVNIILNFISNFLYLNVFFVINKPLKNVRHFQLYEQRHVQNFKYTTEAPVPSWFLLPVCSWDVCVVEKSLLLCGHGFSIYQAGGRVGIRAAHRLCAVPDPITKVDAETCGLFENVRDQLLLNITGTAICRELVKVPVTIQIEKRNHVPLLSCIIR